MIRTGSSLGVMAVVAGLIGPGVCQVGHGQSGTGWAPSTAQQLYQGTNWTRDPRAVPSPSPQPTETASPAATGVSSRPLIRVQAIVGGANRERPNWPIQLS